MCIARRENAAERRKEYAPNGERILVHLSNFRPVKRVTDVIEIFDRVRKKIPSKLLLIGDGPDRSRAEWLAVQKGIHDDVLFLGKQDRGSREAGRRRRHADAQRTGIVRTGGARRHGLRSRSHRHPRGRQSRKSIEHGKSGFLADVGDVETMARYAIDLLGDESALREDGQEPAARSAQARFCASRIIPQYEEFYRRVLERSS